MFAPSTALKRLICRVLIGVLLFAQFAVAAYACPGGPQSLSHAVGRTTAASAPMADSPADLAQPPHAAMSGQSGGEQGAMDPLLPNLCIEHCKFGQQKPDHSPAPALSPVLLTALYTLPALDRPVRVRAAAPAPDSPAPGDPPHSILHCCLRD